MSSTVRPLDENTEFARLMHEGRQALERDDPQQAHDLWKQAALIDPYNEQVWVNLLDVLTDPQDRRVCLENILAINPMNVQARRLLRADEAEEQRRQHVRQQMQKRETELRRQRWFVLRRGVMMGILLALSGIVFAVVLILLTQIQG